MERILNVYKEKLEKEIAKKKGEVRGTARFEELVDRIREDLSNIGRNLLAMFYQELVGYVEQNNASFIESNKDKWDSILERANSLKEYGLYVAPVELIKEENNTLPLAIGVGSFIAAGVLTKLFTKKIKVVPSILIGAIGGVGYNLLFGEDEVKRREMLLEYIDDAQDWMKTALDNMYKIFQDAVA